jgi:hypothetical protein
MPTFSTPEPIPATIELAAGDVRVLASDRADTVVEVRPSTSSHEPDVKAAEQTRVEYTAAGLLIKGPRQRSLSGLRKIGSVDVTVELPAGSQIEAESGIGALRFSGQLGKTRAKIGAGSIDLEEAGPAASISRRPGRPTCKPARARSLSTAYPVTPRSPPDLAGCTSATSTGLP